MIALKDLKFDTPNNSCQSLRMLAEMARTADIKAVDISAIAFSTRPGEIVLHLIPTLKLQ
jgi:tRNA A37 threonylcarbamoyltransferase TsaD